MGEGGRTRKEVRKDGSRRRGERKERIEKRKERRGEKGDVSREGSGGKFEEQGRELGKEIVGNPNNGKVKKEIGRGRGRVKRVRGGGGEYGEVVGKGEGRKGWEGRKRVGLKDRNGRKGFKRRGKEGKKGRGGKWSKMHSEDSDFPWWCREDKWKIP